ncbi:MAG: ATP-binding protein [Anaerolineales bacterium]|nr:ATP-binding protein [Anaerolineales bacterium]
MDNSNDIRGNGKIKAGPTQANVESEIPKLEAIEDNPEILRRAAQSAGAVAFVHFDPNAAKSNMVEGLVHNDDLTKIHRGLYVHILSLKDGRHYTGRVVEGPFYDPDALKRDSTPVKFIILNQGEGKALALPEYHARVQIEILGEERSNVLHGATRRPHPASPIFPYDSTLMSDMLHMQGNLILGLLDNYDDVLVRVDENDKGVVPRNWLTVGTIGSGKSNTNQVFIEETLAANYAQIVVDPEGEYIFMDQQSEMPGIEADLKPYHREPAGVKGITVYHPPLSKSKRDGAIEFSVPFDSLSPDIVVELAEMNAAQQTRFTFLYEQAIKCIQKEKEQQGKKNSKPEEDLDISRGYPGITLKRLIDMLWEELRYYDWKRAHKSDKKEGKKKSGKKGEEEEALSTEEVNLRQMEIYCHRYNLEPLIQEQYDASSYGALSKKLRELDMARIFDRQNTPPLDIKKLCKPGHLSVIDMSDADSQQVINIVIADLLARTYHYKMSLSEEENVENKVFLTIEEAHGFVSREKQDKMEQTLDQLRRIARRGRKRWLALHFVTQSPQHLPSELFELANNKIIHQTTGSENLRVLKAAAGNVNQAIWEDVPSLGRGRAIVVSSQYPHPIITRIRPASSRRNFTS